MPAPIEAVIAVSRWSAALCGPAAVVIVAGAVAVGGCGTRRASDQTSAGADRAFAAAMLAHHESAIYLAEIAQDRGSSAFVRSLADQVIRASGRQIVLLTRRDAELEARGVAVGPRPIDRLVPDVADPERLRDAKPFDARAIDVMIAHHRAGIAIALEELGLGRDRVLRALASETIVSYRRDIVRMRDHLRARR